MKSIQDLEKIRSATKEEISIRQSSGAPRIVIGMGTCGIAAGARDTMLAVIDELRKRHQTDVTISETGCIGLCVKEPVLEVEIPGESKVIYGNVDAGRARQIVGSHVVNHQPVKDWIINVQANEKK